MNNKLLRTRIFIRGLSVCVIQEERLNSCKMFLSTCMSVHALTDDHIMYGAIFKRRTDMENQDNECQIC